MMQQSTKSQFLTTQQSSLSKSYLVKRKKIQVNRSKSPKQYFQQSIYQKHSFQIISKNLSTISADCHHSNKIHNKFSQLSVPNSQILTQNTSDVSQIYHKKKQNKNIKLKTEDIFSKQRSAQSLLENLNSKKIKISKNNFSTRKSTNFNQKTIKKQILIQDPAINPQYSTLFPKIQKNATQKFKSQISQRIQKLNFYRNNSMISQKDPYHILSKQIADKFSIQKLNDYKKLWQKKQRKRKQINLTAKNCQLYKSFSFNASIIDKADQKSINISKNYNIDVQRRKQKCYWEQELRGNKRRYVTIGQSCSKINGLKGHGQNQLQNMEIIPTISIDKNSFLCEEVYKYHK